MATLSVQTLSSPTLLTPTMNSAAAAGDEFANNGKTFLVFANSSGGAITVTFTTPLTVNGVAVADPTVSVADGATRAIVGPFSEATYNNSNGRVAMTYSSHTGLSVGVVSLP